MVFELSFERNQGFRETKVRSEWISGMRDIEDKSTGEIQKEEGVSCSFSTKFKDLTLGL